MSEETKRVYKFKLPWLRRVLNGIDYKYRVAITMGVLVLFTFTEPVTEGWTNAKLVYIKYDWIRTEVKDINNDTFIKLDEEEPPKPVVGTTIRHLREELMQKYAH